MTITKKELKKILKTLPDLKTLNTKTSQRSLCGFPERIYEGQDLKVSLIYRKKPGNYWIELTIYKPLEKGQRYRTGSCLQYTYKCHNPLWNFARRLFKRHKKVHRKKEEKNRVTEFEKSLKEVKKQWQEHQ